MSDEAARQQFARKFPFLIPERLGHTLSQVVFFSMK